MKAASWAVYRMHYHYPFIQTLPIPKQKKMYQGIKFEIIAEFNNEKEALACAKRMRNEK